MLWSLDTAWRSLGSPSLERRDTFETLSFGSRSVQEKVFSCNCLVRGNLGHPSPVTPNQTHHRQALKLIHDLSSCIVLFYCEGPPWTDRYNAILNDFIAVVAAPGSQRSTERKLRLTRSKLCKWKIPFESVSLDRWDLDFRCIGCTELTKETSHNGRRLGTASTQNCKMDRFVFDKVSTASTQHRFEISWNLPSCLLRVCLHRTSYIHILEDAPDFCDKGNVSSTDKTRHIALSENVWDRLVMTCPTAMVKQSWESSSGLGLFWFVPSDFFGTNHWLNLSRRILACPGCLYKTFIKTADLSALWYAWLEDSCRKNWGFHHGLIKSCLAKNAAEVAECCICCGLGTVQPTLAFKCFQFAVFVEFIVTGHSIIFNSYSIT